MIRAVLAVITAVVWAFGVSDTVIVGMSLRPSGARVMANAGGHCRHTNDVCDKLSFRKIES
ncbi:hypothetical protein HL658_13125 [Azospirillum sp. RWY-5-1]|uniref:Uncharacterized protein n=1 Tax=Azospirillum oleiclasticum TaxID=2735135 RepID=A0ABX2T8K6_9PROT|nr:hypothetical protein [Azospirillum oleiclasticum]NYZ13496.1 hypothetical protein [Azospirillum oleiclasticum]NYZ20657.1 hypothetical protein [Azospirillum oleiclasticum]